jgi:site-specific recombinase XerD
MTPELITDQAGTMGADLVPLPSPVPALPLDQVREFVRASKAVNTLRGYQSDWRDFCAWSESRGLGPLPAAPETVAAYIADCAGRLKPGSIQRRLNAIAEAHKAVGLESPTHHAIVANTMKGIRRTLGTAPAQKAPTLTDDIRAMVDAADSGLIGARDRALVLLGFAGAFRRSELVGLDVEDCSFGKDGLTVTLRRSKVDQEAQGRKVGIPYGANPETCPVRVLQAWLEMAGIASGPLFRSLNRHGRVKAGRLSGSDVARVVKKLADRAGLEPAKYAGHSLRAGHATSAAIAALRSGPSCARLGYRTTTVLLNDNRGSEQYHSTNSSNRMPIAALSIGAGKAVEYRRLRDFEVGQSQDRLRATALVIATRLSLHDLWPPNATG